MLPKRRPQVPPAVAHIGEEQVLELYEKFQKSRAKLVGPDGKMRGLPASLHGFLTKLIGDLCSGQPVAPE